MKFHINTETKTIKVEGSVNLKELYDTLDKRFPEKEWEEYSLEGITTFINNYPISYPIYPTYYQYPNNGFTVLANP